MYAALAVYSHKPPPQAGGISLIYSRLDMVHILYIMLNFDEVYISDIPPAVSIATWYIHVYTIHPRALPPQNELQYQDAVLLKIQGSTVEGPEGTQSAAISECTGPIPSLPVSTSFPVSLSQPHSQSPYLSLIPQSPVSASFQSSLSQPHSQSPCLSLIPSLHHLVYSESCWRCFGIFMHYYTSA